MKLSTRSRYGLRAMVDLADLRSADLRAMAAPPVPLSALAGKQGISEAYLEQLLRALKRAGLVTASRGVNGGYRLARPPETISVEDILRALEGRTSVADCVSGEGVACESACTCAARPLFLKLQARITGVLESTTLYDLATEHQEQKDRMHHAKKRLS